jgi:alpha-ketoglutarate-dependent taurine dioxygenase
MSPIESRQMSETLGLEIRGVSGREFVDRAVADRCLGDLGAHGVLVYRDADIGDADLVALSRMLGEVVVAPMGGLADHPEVSAVTLDPAKSELAEYRKGTFFWHIDGATDPIPQKATLLTAREVAEEGGDTEFANTYAAFESLPERDQRQLEGVRVLHSFAAAQALTYPDASPKQRAAWARGPKGEQPLVWTRPDGRKSLLVGATAEGVVGRSPEEGRALLDRLLAWVTEPRFVLRHQWRPGDLVIWDNTGILHRALPYEPTSRRLLHRTTLAGELKVA